MTSRNRGKSKPTLNKLMSEHPTIAEKGQLRQSFSVSDAPPIVTAILGQALLDHLLEVELRKRLKHRDDETWAKITNVDGPLNSFNSKITSAYAQGIINEVLRDAFHTVRKIRNVFGHAKKPLDFSHELIVQELKKVTLPAGKKSKLYKILSNVRKMTHGPQSAFVVLCLVLELQIERKRSTAEQARIRRSFRKNPTPLVAALLGLHLPEEVSSLGFFRGRQNAGPTPKFPEASIFAPPKTKKDAPGKGGKQ